MPITAKKGENCGQRRESRDSLKGVGERTGHSIAAMATARPQQKFRDSHFILLLLPPFRYIIPFRYLPPPAHSAHFYGNFASPQSGQMDRGILRRHYTPSQSR
jgi:hypothetical protein